jgi:hypothetical protein
MAPDVLLALVEAGVVLWVEEGRLRYRAPAGVLGEDLQARVAACRPALVAMVTAGALLPADQADWPEDATENVEERAAIMEFDGMLPREVAEQKADRRVRLGHLREWLARAAAGSSA